MPLDDQAPLGSTYKKHHKPLHNMQRNLNSRIIGARNGEHPFKILCLIGATMLSFTLSVRATILDDLFQWAAQQPSTNVTTVQLAMTSNEITNTGRVTYAGDGPTPGLDGTLYYYPPVFNGYYMLPARFSSANGIKLYWSTRGYDCNSQFASYPFGWNNTEPITITVSPLAFGDPIYSITLNSTDSSFTFRFVASFDANTKILYGTSGNKFLTVSLYNRDSRPPQVPPR
jgi:hypothetical protein